MICEKCGINHNGTYGSGRFCSAKCARGFSSNKVTEEGRKKQKTILQDKNTHIKSYNARLKNSENYELNSEGEWVKKPKSKQYKSKGRNNQHTLTFGKIGELTTAKKFLQHGYDVYVPLVDTKGVDMIVEKNDGPKKIQVKSSAMTSNDNNCTKFSLRSSDFNMKNGKVISYNKKYKKKNVDYFALYSAKDDDIYLIDNDENRTQFTIRNQLSEDDIFTKGKNLEKLHMAEDYQIDKVLNDIDKGIDTKNIIIVEDFEDRSN